MREIQTVNPSDSNSDQTVINNALEAVYQSGGRTVNLNPGVYTIDGQIKIGSNTVLIGSPDAIVRVHVHRPPAVTLNETPEEFHISTGLR